MNNILIIGIGNTLMKDDGVGVFAVKELVKKYILPQGVEVIIAGSMVGIELIPYLQNREKVLFVDALDMDAPAGTIKVISDKEITSHAHTLLQEKVSVHQIGLSELIATMLLIGDRPKEICLIGIKPQEISIGEELSKPLQQKMNSLLSTIVNILKEWGIILKRKENVSCCSL